MDWLRNSLISVSFLTFVLNGYAAIPPKVGAASAEKVLEKRGRITGGLAGTGFSLLGLARSELKNGERLVVDVGDLYGQELKGPPGYFHVELQENPKRIVLDMAQLQTAKITEKEINLRLKGSAFVKSSQLIQDPLDQSTSLILSLKDSVNMKVYQVTGSKSTSKIVLDILRTNR